MCMPCVCANAQRSKKGGGHCGNGVIKIEGKPPNVSTGVKFVSCVWADWSKYVDSWYLVFKNYGPIIFRNVLHSYYQASILHSYELTAEVMQTFVKQQKQQQAQMSWGTDQTRFMGIYWFASDQSFLFGGKGFFWVYNMITPDFKN